MHVRTQVSQWYRMKRGEKKLLLVFCSHIVTNEVIIQREQLFLVSVELHCGLALVFVSLKNPADLNEGVQRLVTVHRRQAGLCAAGKTQNLCSPAPCAHPGQPSQSRHRFWGWWFPACPASHLPHGGQTRSWPERFAAMVAMAATKTKMIT